MTSLIVSRHTCVGLMCGTLGRMLLDADVVHPLNPALFIAALFGYWVFGRAIRQAIAAGEVDE